MKYLWILVLVGAAALVFFNNAAVSSKFSLAALISLEPLPEPLPVSENRREALIAKVHSTYPFNHRSFFTIAAGSGDGIKAGMAVTADGNHLLGRVAEVFENESVVRTIFDNNWAISVRVGPGGADALLVAGQEPALTLIDKKSAVSEGEWVYSASREFPYGLKLGTVRGLREADADPFQESDLELPYRFNEIKEVAVLIK